MVKNNLLKIRLKLGYKFQKEFADFLEIGEKDYNRIENNRKQVTLDTALRISKKLKIPVEEIFILID